MTPEQWQALKPLFERALDLPPSARAALIEEVRLKDENLASVLAGLIESHEKKTEQADQPVLRFDALSPRESPLLSPGQLVLDRFKIVRLIGRGGMGDVYQADDLQLGPVALKTIRAAIANDPVALQRFKQEVVLARKISSPCVCRIHELFVLPQPASGAPTAFLSMELLDGKTLADRVRSAGALPLSEARSIASQLCAALQAVHSAGVIHRDVKSNNIMLVTRQGTAQAVLMDLGLACHAAPQSPADSTVTAPGAVEGTSEYMAPEQFEGSHLTPAADIYALGVVLYEMTTGARPFQASTPLAAAVRRARRLPPATSLRPDLPPQWDSVIARCLEFDPERRYQTAGEVAAALEDQPQPPPPPKPAARGASRFLLPVLAVLLAVAALAFFLWRHAASPPPPPDAQRRYDDGVSAIHEGSFLKATRLLTRALEIDPDFVLAHVRLAEAWAELDFTGKAQQELLLASNLESTHNLAGLAGQYLKAVRHSVTRQFDAAVQDYTVILNQLRSADKPYGLVDLGRAREKTNRLTEAEQNYGQAVKLAPEDPAPLIRLAVIEVKSGENDQAETHFRRAETLYKSASDTEGLAEISFQRGVAAILKGDTDHAQAFLSQALHSAEDIDSKHLQIRCLTQLGANEYGAGDISKAIAIYKQAVDLANQHGLDIWATEGQIRAGIAYIDERQYDQANTLIQQGLSKARELQNPRLQALANVGLASVNSQRGLSPAEIAAPAQQALDFYKTSQYVGQSTSALILLVRALGDQSDFQKASPYASELLEIAPKTMNPAQISQAQEAVGGLYQKQQRYPEALAYFQASRKNAPFPALAAANYANALASLGRYSEARRLLDSLTHNEKIQNAVLLAGIQAAALLNQNRFADAMRVAEAGLRKTSALTPVESIELRIDLGIAQAELGAAQQARQSCQLALAAAQRQSNPSNVAEASVCAARASLAAKSPAEARSLAESALQFFASSQQMSSEWQSLLILAKSCSKSGDASSAATYAKKALDIFNNLENNWGSTTYKLYLTRPDATQARRELRQLAER